MPVVRRKNPAMIIEAHPLNQLDFLTVEIYWDNESRCYVTRIPELFNISTQGGDEEAALDMTVDQLLGWLQFMEDKGKKIPLTKAQIRKVREVLAG